MKPKWLLERDVFDEGNPEKMAEIIRALGMECQTVGVVPFSRNSFVQVGPNGVDRIIYKSNMPYAAGDCVVVYGSINLCQRLYHDNPWTPTAWFNLANMRCRTYFSHWGEHLLQQDYMMLSFAEFRRKKNFLYSAFGATKDIFVKPDENVKTFSGTVVPYEKFDRWVEMTNDCYCPDPDMLVVVAQPCNIALEWRFVVHNGRVVTGSQYKVAGKTEMSAEVPAGAIEFAEKMAKHQWQPEPIYVLDVCQVGDQYFVLEIGEVNCAGLYRCDLEKVVDAMTEQAEMDWTETHGP